MPIITGSEGDFGRLVAEEFRRRAQRVVDVGQTAPDTDVAETPAGDEADQCDGDRHNHTDVGDDDPGRMG